MHTDKVAALVLLLFVNLLPLRAQTLATLEGTTFDTTRAVLPGTLIEITGPTVSRTVFSDEKGFYRLMSLPAGDYTITLTHLGFTILVLMGLVLVMVRIVTIVITI